MTHAGLIGRLLLALSLAWPVWAQPVPPQEPPAKIGAEDDWYPYSAARQGKPTGTAPDLRGKLVAVTNGCEHGEVFDSDPGMRRDVAPSDLFALQKLALGRVDYALVYDRVVDTLLAEHAELRGKVKTVGTLIEPDIYLSFAPAYPEVTRYIVQFDEGLSRIKLNGEYARILARWGALGSR